MRLAIIGCGSIGTRHLKNALALGCEVSVADVDPERPGSALALGATRWSFYYGASVETQLDALMVCTPYDMHIAWAQWAIDRKVPVFVEKPLGSLDQIEDWRRLVDHSQGLVTQVGYQCRFHPKARAMKALGPFHGAGFSCSVDTRKWPGKSYGPAWLEASHDLDLALWMGAPLEVTSAARGTAVLGESWAVYVNDNAEYQRHWFASSERASCSVRFDSPEELGDQMYVDELKHFLDCVQSGRQTDVPLSDGLRVLEVCKQVEEMARATA
jgi:predicted dehydrogenase